MLHMVLYATPAIMLVDMYASVRLGKSRSRTVNLYDIHGLSNGKFPNGILGRTMPIRDRCLDNRQNIAERMI
jgi:hypothetical protein